MKTIQKLRPNFVFERDYSDGGINDDIQGATGTRVGTSSWINSSRGKSIRTPYNGVSASGLLYSNAAYAITAGTIIAMISRNTIQAGYQEIIYRMTGYNLYFSGNAVGMYDYAGGTGFMSSGISITDLSPHVVVIKFENGASGVKFWVDGVAGNTDTWTIGANANELKIGYGADANLSGGADIHYVAISTSTTISNEDISTLSVELLEKGFTTTLSKRGFTEPVLETTTELQPYLVSSWDMKNLTNTIPDISGGGHTLTRTSGMGETKGLFENAQVFGGVSYLTRTEANYRSVDSEGFIEALIWLDSLPATSAYFGTSDTASGTLQQFLYITSSGRIGIQNYNGTTQNAVLSPTGVVGAGRWVHAIIGSNSSAYSIFVDGVEQAKTLSTGLDNGHWFADIANRDNLTIGALVNSGGVNYPFNGKINFIKVHNTAPTQAIVDKLYARVAKKLIYRNTFEDAQVTLGTSSVDLNGFTPLTGTWKNSEDSTKKKWLENVTVGTVYTNNEQAYGTFQCDFYLTGATQTLAWNFINTKADGSGNGYRIYMTGSGGIYIPRVTAGGTSTQAYTALGYFALNTKYSIRITRNYTGLTYIYIRGGAYTTWTQMSVAGGGGANPFTDNTFTTSNIMNVTQTIASGSKIGNIIIKQGVCDPSTYPEI